MILRRTRSVIEADRVPREPKEGREVPRKGNVPKREVLPDPVYGSVVVSKLINSIMLDGKKGVAQSIVYDAFDQIKESTTLPYTGSLEVLLSLVRYLFLALLFPP